MVVDGTFESEVRVESEGDFAVSGLYRNRCSCGRAKAGEAAVRSVMFRGDGARAVRARRGER